MHICLLIFSYTNFCANDKKISNTNSNLEKSKVENKKTVNFQPYVKVYYTDSANQRNITNTSESNSVDKSQTCGSTSQLKKKK